MPSDHANDTFNFHVSRRAQAEWLGAALRIARRSDRIYTFSWFTLCDEPPIGPGGRPGSEVNWGLLDWRGRRSRRIGRSSAADSGGFQP